MSSGSLGGADLFTALLQLGYMGSHSSTSLESPTAILSPSSTHSYANACEGRHRGDEPSCTEEGRDAGLGHATTLEEAATPWASRSLRTLGALASSWGGGDHYHAVVGLFSDRGFGLVTAAGWWLCYHRPHLHEWYGLDTLDSSPPILLEGLVEESQAHVSLPRQSG